MAPVPWSRAFRLGDFSTHSGAPLSHLWQPEPASWAFQRGLSEFLWPPLHSCLEPNCAHLSLDRGRILLPQTRSDPLSLMKTLEERRSQQRTIQKRFRKKRVDQRKLLFQQNKDLSDQLQFLKAENQLLKQNCLFLGNLLREKPTLPPLRDLFQ